MIVKLEDDEFELVNGGQVAADWTDWRLWDWLRDLRTDVTDPNDPDTKHYC